MRILLFAIRKPLEIMLYKLHQELRHIDSTVAQNQEIRIETGSKEMDLVIVQEMDLEMALGMALEMAQGPIEKVLAAPLER